MSKFDEIFQLLIGHEGGFTNNAADPGNWTGGGVGAGVCKGTKYGISAKSYPDEDIAGMTLERAAAIYREHYWAPIRGDDLPAPLALMVFDSAVNNGVGNAVRWLQEAVGAHTDGVMGPATLAAVTHTVASTGGAALCAEFMVQRTLFMSHLAIWSVFGLGWLRRLFSLVYQSLQVGA